ncbi:hypothetical protein CP965_10475 [Halarcobacter mediterraneus]|uniref:Uncharacterized protein n=1 Tax=Halarcobacter mediterraneus TaxID=2023153 RepID=A0A4Q1ARN7_9BACT|nr:hypothetical protein [Halarcobacter mediterraneus]RXK12195.1 hypothetical protein CP965_10475 [Halarcobacter mediterraneus]
MIIEISEFFYGFKTKVIDTKSLEKEYAHTIFDFAQKIKDKNLHKEYEDNFLTILGYSFRLEDIAQRLFFTFQEAVYAIDLDIQMKNEDSKKLNSIVYVLVIEVLLKEFQGKFLDEELKQKALETYKKIEERKAKENKKYHMYQY